MSRIPISAIANGTLLTTVPLVTSANPTGARMLTPGEAVSVNVCVHNGFPTQVQVWSAETAGVVLTQPLVSGSDGTIPGWIDVSSLPADLVVNGEVYVLPTVGGQVNAITAADGTITVAGTATAPTVKVASGQFDASGAATTAVTAHTAATDPHGDRAYADTNKASKAANLSDLANAGTARTNLGLGTAATQASSAFDTAGAATAAQSAAQGYADTNKLAKASNLSDVASAATARANLGSDSAYVHQDGTGLPISVVSDSALVDLNRGFSSTAAVNPGDDITTALQAAYDYIAANFANGGRIRFSKGGLYTQNGALQTGTFTSGTSTYTYRGQILLPAVSLANTMTIKLEAAVPAGSGNPNTGGPTGVIIQSNATTGYLMDCRPSFARFAAFGVGGNPLCCWTGVVPEFEGITFLAPDNPTCGGLNLFCTQRAQLRRTYVQTPTFEAVVPSSGSLAGIVMPQVNNNGNVVFEHGAVNGFPVGVVLSEHLRARNIYIAGCLSAFGSSGTGHTNLIDADVEECPTVFAGAAYGGITGTPNTAAGTMVTGDIDFENVATSGGLQPAAGAFVSDTRAGPVQGQVRFWNEGNKTLPVAGGTLLDVVPLSKAPTSGPVFRAGWMSTHPYDNFGRLQALAAGQGPGQCSATYHPGRVEAGTFAVSASGQLSAGVNPSYVFWPCLKGGVSRIISTTFQLAAGGQIRVLGQSPVAASGGAVGTTFNIEVRCAQGSAALLRMNNSNVLGLSGGNLAAATTYTVDLEILYGWQTASGVLQAGYPVFVRVYLNGTLVGQAAIPASLATLGGAAPVTFPIYEDGLGFLDTSSFATLFRVRDSNADPRARHLVAATATRTAWHFETTICTSGTFTVTLPQPVQDVPNTVVNTGAGTITVAPPSGTLTNLSAVTGNIALTQGQHAEIVSPDGTNFQQIA